MICNRHTAFIFINKGCIFISVVLLFLNNFLNAQESIHIIDYVEISNTSRNGTFYHQLIFNKEKALFKQAENFESDEDYEDSAEGRSFRFDIPFSNKDLDYYSSNPFDAIIKYRHNYSGKSLYVKDTIPMKWKLIDETKEILGFVCHKAITTFRGRTYHAWFALNLNYPYGPWKLHGLPGVILEVKDQRDGIAFYARKLEIKKTSINSYLDDEIEKRAKFLSFSKYCSEKKEILKRNRKKIESKMPSGVRFARNCEDCQNLLETCD